MFAGPQQSLRGPSNDVRHQLDMDPTRKCHTYHALETDSAELEFGDGHGPYRSCTVRGSVEDYNGNNPWLRMAILGGGEELKMMPVQCQERRRMCSWSV
jgi:hypothetical protein